MTEEDFSIEKLFDPEVEHDTEFSDAACPDCHLFAMVIKEGCEICTGCGYSKCG